MVASRHVRALVLVGLGVALLFNSVWLFPAEGERRSTYDRAEITVENGTLDYRNADNGPGHEYNDLVPVACDAWTAGRACAFDEHLAADGPVTVTGDTRYGSERDFVRLDGRYYRRSTETTDNGTVYDVGRVAPEALLDEVAINITGVTPEAARDRSLQTRVAVTGEAQHTTATPDRGDAGRIYRRAGTYYTVVVVGAGTVDAPIFAEWMHSSIAICGLILFVGAVLVGVDDRRPEL
jgi:hypothetical protein